MLHLLMNKKYLNSLGNKTKQKTNRKCEENALLHINKIQIIGVAK